MKKGLFYILLFCFAACSKKSKDEELAPMPVFAPPPTSAAASEKKEEPVKYSYPYAQKRDPFLPLAGTLTVESGESKSPFAASETNPEKAFANLELRGILRDAKGRVALIKSSDGESYTLKSGRIYDDRNRIVSGVAGIIKENSILLISENKTMKLLELARRGGAAANAAPAQVQTAASATGR